MAIATVRPDATTAQSNMSIGGGAGSHHAAHSDDLDTTYSVPTSSGSGSGVTLGFATISVTGSQRIKQIRMRVRGRQTDVVADWVQLFTASGALTSLWWTPPFTSTITTHTSPWYTTAADGSEWTSYASTVVAAFGAPTGTADVVRWYETFLDADVRDLLTLGAPTVTGTATTRPTIAWTPTLNAEGDPQKKYQIYVYPSAVYSAGGFVAGTTAGWAWASGETTGTSSSVQVGTDLTFGLTYRAYVRVAQDWNGADWWTAYSNDSGFTLAIPGDATPQPPAPTMTRTVDDPNAKVVIALTAGLNALTANQSSIETATTGWAAGTNTTIARVVGTPTPAHATASMSLTKTVSTGTALANTPTGTSGFAVLPSTQYTALASFRTAVTARTCKIAVKWYTSAGSYLSSDDLLSAGVVDATGSWTATSVTGTSPATAAFASLELQALAAVSTEVHYADKIGFQPGSSTGWNLGGYLSLATSQILLEYQEVLGPNFLPANVADAGDTGQATTGFYKRTVGDLLELYGAAPLYGTTSIRWGPSAAASVLDAGMLSTSPNYDLAPLVAPGKAMVASAWVRADTGTFQVTLGVGAHNNAGAVGSLSNGSPVTVGTTWTRITSGALTVGDTALYGYVAFDNTADTTTGRLLIDKVQLEVGSVATDWVHGTGDRPTTWAETTASPILATSLSTSQQAWLHDYEVKRGRGVRLYRAYVQVVEGTSFLSSTNVYAGAYNSVVDALWWFKDPSFPGLNWSTAYVLDSIGEQVGEDIEVVHPLGRSYPVSVSSWISAGSDGTLQAQTFGEADWQALERLLRRQNVLLLQAPSGMNKYIRITERAWERRGPRARLTRVVTATYHQEAAP